MTQEFNLSKKIISEGYYIRIEDVKEFIKKLKEEMERLISEKREKNKTGYYDIQNFRSLAGYHRQIKNKIDTLAGDKLK